MSDNNDDYIPRAAGCNVAISFFEGEPDPVLVLGWRTVDDKPDVQVAFLPDDLEQMLPVIIGAVIRARTVMEVTTIYPEQREEIVKNLMFRWAGVIVEEEGGEEG